MPGSNRLFVSAVGAFWWVRSGGVRVAGAIGERELAEYVYHSTLPGTIMGLLQRSACAVAIMATAACARIATTSAPGSAADAATIRAQISATLAHGARAWNGGNLDDFVSDYDPGPGTSYIGGRGMVHGVAAIRAAYAPRFAPGAQRDSLHFESLEVDVLAPDVVNAVAYYVLMRGDSVTARGPTSLVMRRTDGRWRIIHDHSS